MLSGSKAMCTRFKNILKRQKKKKKTKTVQNLIQRVGIVKLPYYMLILLILMTSKDQRATN